MGLYASFVPKPNTVYQIKPSLIYYIVATDAGINEPKPASNEVGAVATIDFSIHPHHIQLVHDDDNQLRIRDDADLSVSTL